MASTAESIENNSGLSTQESQEASEIPVPETNTASSENDIKSGGEVSTNAAEDQDVAKNANLLSDKDPAMDKNVEADKPDVVEENFNGEVASGEEIDEKESVVTPDEIGAERHGESDEVGPSQENAEKADESPEPKDEDISQYVDLLGNGLLKKKILKAATEDSCGAAAGQEVCMKTKGTLDSGEQVDVHEALTFIVGDGDVITAWDLCVTSMKERETCELKVAPRFAYGSLGKDDEHGDVPPDSNITYVLELLSVKPGPDITSLTEEQRIEFGDQKRERGNELFRREEYSEAVYSYQRALKYLGTSTAEAIMELKVKCWNNISASHLKLEEYAAASRTCDSVLEVQPENVKALFRKGKVLHAQGEYEQSLEILRKAYSIDPDNRLVRRELQAVRIKCDQDRQKERSMYQRMVSGLSEDSGPGSKNTFFTWPVVLGITGVAIGGILAALLFTRH